MILGLIVLWLALNVAVVAWLVGGRYRHNRRQIRNTPVWRRQ